MKKSSNHITTYTGLDFTPLCPNIQDIKIEDIAHSLSLMCRANGHFTHFFSVGQHSINCANEAKANGYSFKLQLACLIHDASEAYISDITRPVKAELLEYQAIEKHLQEAIYIKYLGRNLTEEESILLKQIDDAMLIHEFQALMKKKVFKDHLPDIKTSLNFEFIMFDIIEREFLDLFTTIINNCN